MTLHDLGGRLSWLLFKSQTSSTRMWFGLASIFFGVFMYLSDTVHNPDSEYVLMLQIAPDWLWASGFLVHGVALLYGVITRRYSTILLLVEGVLGVALWTAASIAMSVSQGAVGASAAGALIAAWICIRYPTHAEFKQ